MAALAVAIGLYVIYVLYAYGRAQGYLDHMEPSVAVPAWLWLQGRPLYPAAGGPIEMIMTFGPVIFLLNAAALVAFGGTIMASKLAGLIAAGAGLGVMLLFLLKRARPLAATLFVAFAAFVLFAAPASLWNRPDSVLLLVAALGVYAASFDDRRDGMTAALAVGACIGIAANLKMHGFLYLAPAAIDVMFHAADRRDTARRFAALSGAAIVVFLAPFALPGISLIDYATNLLSLTAGVGGSAEVFLKVLRVVPLYLTPVLPLLWLAWMRRDNIATRDVIHFGVLTLVTLALLYPASRPGAGAHHLLPLLPATIDSLARFCQADTKRHAGKSIAVAFALVLVILAIPVQRRFDRQIAAIDARSVAADLQAFVSALEDGKTVEMGFGESFEHYRDTFLRTVLVLAGQPFTFDAMTAMELKGVGLPLPARFRDHVSTCKTDFWLIPVDEKPFAMPSYWGNGPAFNPEFTAAFLATYRRQSSTRFFDVWGCSTS